MLIDIDKILLLSIPWEFKAEHQDTTYAMREPSDEEKARLKDLATMKPDAALEFVDSLFLDPKPDLRTWKSKAISTILIAYATYIIERNRRNDSMKLDATKKAVQDAAAKELSVMEGKQ
jgi:hypothetical protein